MSRIPFAALAFALTVGLMAGATASAKSPHHRFTPHKTPAARAHARHIHRTVRKVDQRNRVRTRVTSRHRNNSTAHARGALDFSTRGRNRTQRQAHARQYSKALGRGYNVVVERVSKPRVGPPAQINTTYNNGLRGRRRVGPIKASATHIHVQPNRGTRAPRHQRPIQRFRRR